LANSTNGKLPAKFLPSQFVRPAQNVQVESPMQTWGNRDHQS